VESRETICVKGIFRNLLRFCAGVVNFLEYDRGIVLSLVSKCVLRVFQHAARAAIMADAGGELPRMKDSFVVLLLLDLLASLFMFVIVWLFSYDRDVSKAMAGDAAGVFAIVNICADIFSLFCITQIEGRNEFTKRMCLYAQKVSLVLRVYLLAWIAFAIYALAPFDRANCGDTCAVNNGLMLFLTLSLLFTVLALVKQVLVLLSLQRKPRLRSSDLMSGHNYVPLEDASEEIPSLTLVRTRLSDE